MQLSTQPVNLFLTKMFYKTSFYSWLKYMKESLKKKKHEKKVE